MAIPPKKRETDPSSRRRRPESSQGANDVSYFPFDELVEALVLALSLLAIEMAQILDVFGM